MYRIEKMNSGIATNVSKIFSEELELPEEVLVSVTKVSTSQDLSFTDIWLSIMPDIKEEIIIKYIKENIFEIQKLFNEKMPIKKIPKLRFRLDKSQQKISKVENLIQKIHKEDE